MKKILVANRGEIALRIIRACRDAGYASVAIASDADRAALHALSADEVHTIPGNSPRDTYLNQAAILEIAARAGADAVHPGYGFLSENETFAAAVEAAGLTWIGPPADVIARLGDKVAARAVARTAGAPLLPSLEEGALTLAEAQAFVAEHGLPVIVKAQNGGGGRGMRVVRDTAELAPQIEAAEREAGIAFGRPECFLERFVEDARHVETQCLADSHGKVIVLSTRDCTLQRRHQKLVEEAPAPFLDADQEARLTEASTAILRGVGYRGAATCEFLVTREGEIYFLEVNTRVQVEHPVTEEVTGVDIIREMFRIAEGGHLPDPPGIRGHSIEFRVNAEDAAADFRPTPGRISTLRLPSGPGVRADFGYLEGDAVPPYYDSLIGKLIITGRDRDEALERARRALAEFRIGGVTTVAPLHRVLLGRDEFRGSSAEAFTVSTRWIDETLADLVAAMAGPEVPAAPPVAEEIRLDLPPETTGAASAAYRIGIKAPLSGMVIELCVSEGDSVAEGDVVAIMEAMKMEQPIMAEVSGKVARINTTVGSFIEMEADILGID